MRPENATRVRQLSTALDSYRTARQHILATLALDISNRDPLAEWSEHFVAALTGGDLAPSRVQARYDLVIPDGLRVQVRYLANPKGAWINEHLILTPPGVNRYALVLFEAFEPIGALMFPAELAAIGQALAKRHGNQESSLQFTRRNWLKIRDDPSRFRALGVQVWLPPFGT